MNIIIESNLKALKKSRILVSSLSDDELSNNSISPYYSSIGSHIRHICDFYECVLNINENTTVDLTARKRNLDVENCCDSALDHIEKLTNRLKALRTISNDKIYVIDDLGSGKIKIDYTYSGLLAQANSHTIHHYAIINYILDRLGIKINDTDFGYNPTTPKRILVS